MLYTYVVNISHIKKRIENNSVFAYIYIYYMANIINSIMFANFRIKLFNHIIVIEASG